MKKIFFLFFVVHVILLFSGTGTHTVHVQIEDSGGNFPLPEYLSFEVELYHHNGSTYDLAGTLSYPANSSDCKYLYEDGGLLYVDCAGFGNWYYAEEEGTGTLADYVKFIPDLSYETELSGDYEEVELTDANTQSVAITYDTDGSLLTGIVVGFNEDIQGKDVTTFGGAVSFTYGTTSGALEATVVNAQRGGARDFTGTITVKQFDITRNTIPGYDKALNMIFDVNISTDYNGGYPFDVVFEWNSPDTESTDNPQVIYTRNNGALWIEVPEDDSDSYFKLTSTPDYDETTSGDEKKYSATIRFKQSPRHDSDVSFAFNDGNTGSNLLQLQKPTNISAEIISSEVSTETTCSFSWNGVPGADTYKILSRTGTKNGTFDYVMDPDSPAIELETTTTSVQLADFDINSRTIFYKVEANATSYDSKESDIYCIVEYAVTRGKGNNGFISLPFDDLSYTASELWANIPKVGSLAQWDANGEYWDASTRVKMPDQVSFWWLNDKIFDANKPILANTGTGNEAIFFSGSLSEARTPTWNLIEGVNYIYIPLDTDLTTIASLKTAVESETTGLDCIEIARYQQIYKLWQYTNESESWTFNNVPINVLDALYSSVNIIAGFT